MKPIIGVMPLWDDGKKSIWMLPGYMDGIAKAGGLPVILPMNTDTDDLMQLACLCSGFLFTGGQDVNPEIYGEEPLAGLSDYCIKRDKMEQKILEYSIKNDIPTLGICRGIQFINASLGGTLYQDIPTQHPSDICHTMKAPYDRTAHKVKILRDTPMYDLLQKDVIGVNSYHHQAIKELSPLLIKMAEAEDGLTEAVYMPGKKFIWAVQWHPEYSYKKDENSLKILEKFVSEAK